MSEIKIDRATGSVSRDGKIIGRVVKDCQTIGAMIMGADPTMWSAYHADGWTVCRNQARQRDAVRHLDRATRPAAVEGMRISEGWTGRFYEASYSWEGNHVSVSSYPSEVDEDGNRVWVVDSLTPCGAFFPHFSNGAGTRVTRAQVLHPEHARAVSEALAASGLHIDD
jgi:hypothetical protein